jgi:hypothetical protein
MGVIKVVGISWIIWRSIFMGDESVVNRFGRVDDIIDF